MSLMMIGLPLKSLASRGNSFAPALRTSTLSSKVHQTCLSSRRLVSSFVAEMDSRVVGVVGYGPPNQLKQSAFDPAWAVVRMLSTHSDARGRGVGRLLVNECKRRARRDRANILALTTTKINEVALKMYLKMGFR